MSEQNRLSGKEAAGLWHAVQAFADCVRAMRKMDGFTAAQIDREQARLENARRALRKVQVARKSTAQEPRHG